MRPTLATALLLALATGCSNTPQKITPPKENSVSFQSDVDFLKQHTPVVLLSDPDGQAQVAIAPAYQGRVMTSTAAGQSGQSFGWINRDLIASGKKEPHINPYGGEDRFWLGPEGGPFSIFFKHGDKQELPNWQTPAAIDTEPFEVSKTERTRATFMRTIRLNSAANTTFDLQVERTIQLLDSNAAFRALSTPAPDNVRLVAYESNNKITNIGQVPWKRDTGLLSIWILGMFNPSPSTTIVIPIRGQAEMVLNDTYFGKVPPDRLKLASTPTGQVGYFSGDGKYRSKIGISPAGALPILGSYDAANHVLTLVQYNGPHRDQPYVNSTWGDQKDPYAGDTVNSYNDGPPSPGAKPLGPFYELETSSPAAALAPTQSLTHTHRTIHITGDEPALDQIARKTLGVTLDEIKNGLK